MPSATDPLGLNDPPTPAQAFNEGLRLMINSEIRSILRGRVTHELDNMPDAILAMELIARGWVAYKPSQPLIREEPA